MPRSAPLTSRHIPEKLLFRAGGSGNDAEETSVLRSRGVEGVVFDIPVAGGRSGEEGILSTSSLREALHDAKEHGLSPWLHLTSEFLDLGRRRSANVGALLTPTAGGPPQTTEVVDYANLKCNKADRRLLLEMHREVPEVEGFLLGPVIDLRVFSEEGFHYSDGFRTEFTDRHGYDPLTRMQSPDFRLKRDYYSTWEDLLFRLHSSLCFAIEQLWSPATPIVYHHLQRPGCVAPDLWRMALASNCGAIIGWDRRVECANLAEGIAWSIRRYHPRKQAWTLQDGTEVVAASSDNAALVDVAVIFNWDALAAMETEMREDYCNSLTCLASALKVSGLSFDVIPPKVITSAEEPTETGGFRRSEAEYRCVVYPYAWFLRQVDWEVLEAFSLQGGKVLYYGPAPCTTAEGLDVREAFENLMAAKVSDWHEGEKTTLNLEYAGARFDRARETPGAVFKLQTDSPSIEADGRPICVKKGNTFYLAFDAGTMAPELIALLVREYLQDATVS